MGDRPTIVAIDGPAGAGKSSVARLLAARLHYTLVDTGAIYRVVALVASRQGVAFDDADGLEAIAGGLRLRFEMLDGENHVFLGEEDVSGLIRTPEISLGASAVSAQPGVRAGLLELQRRFATGSGAPGAVLEGRDIGTVVFPDADHKFFLTASAKERARRRYDEMRSRGQDAVYQDVLDDQEQRDAQDRGREVAPLKPAADATQVNTDGMTLEEVLGTLESIVLDRA